ncbi:MAG TPA: zf-HC2 domain-containing protein [Bryobacteraceae bacterium]|nr:zf-HC2 domain-containing protein [Bryobacteraceae bacterium]
MSCSPFDLRDYLFGELANPERRQVEQHVRNCNGCHEDLERLRVTHAALLSLREEELPQRIGFVSDKVFEPSPLRRAWQTFWGSSARLGFASAAMLSAALVVFAYRPMTVPAVSPAQPDTAKIEAVVAQRVSAAVEKAVAESEARQGQKSRDLLAAAERNYQEQRAADMERVKEAFTYLEKRYNTELVADNRRGAMQ